MVLFIRSCIQKIHQDTTSFYLILFSLLGYIATYVFNLVLAHELNPIRLGECNLALRILDILATLSLLGTNVASKRFLAKFLSKTDNFNIRDFIQWNLKLVIKAFILCVIVAIGSYVILHVLHLWGLHNIKTYHMSIYMLWISPLAALFLLLNSYLLCANQVILSNLLSNLRTILLIIFFLIMSLFLDLNEYSINIISVFFLSFIILLLMEMICINLYYPQLLLHLKSAFTLSTNQVHEEWLNVSLRMGINSILFLILTASDLFIIQIVDPNKSDVGYYAVCLTIASVIFIIPKNLQSVLKPLVSSLTDHPDGLNKLQDKIKSINRYSFWIILILSLGIIMFSDSLLLHFGEAYLQAKPCLILLAIAFMIAGYSQAATTVIAFSGHESLLLKISIYEILVLIILGIPLTYLFSINGTAIATLGAMVFKAGIFHHQSYHRLNLNTMRF